MRAGCITKILIILVSLLFHTTTASLRSTISTSTSLPISHSQNDVNIPNARQALRTHVHDLLLRNDELAILLEDRSKTQDTKQVSLAKHRLATHIVNFLQQKENEPIYSGLSESSDLCAKLLNTWMATCVFGR
tara:strand:- start:68 stop:466 length:399 start_codon:yes stop_codon:yes gene_type:complete